MGQQNGDCNDMKTVQLNHPQVIRTNLETDLRLGAVKTWKSHRTSILQDDKLADGAKEELSAIPVNLISPPRGSSKHCPPATDLKPHPQSTIYNGASLLEDQGFFQTVSPQQYFLTESPSSQHHHLSIKCGWARVSSILNHLLIEALPPSANYTWSTEHG